MVGGLNDSSLSTAVSRTGGKIIVITKIIISIYNGDFKDEILQPSLGRWFWN